MKGILLFAGLVTALMNVIAQESGDPFQNSAEKLLATDGKLTIGGYGEVHFNKPYDAELRYNGKLDVHRMVMLFGYNFNARTQFITEIEYEHVKEVYIEQAFLQYRLTDLIHLKGGLLLIPMGLINEYHEPTTFNGVERPAIDKVIAPTTWREIGFGASGTILPFSVRYQAYLVNGFSSYNGGGLINGKNGLRKGRQKGAESILSSPNFSGKIEYYGLRGLHMGFAGYFGKTQSSLYEGIEKNTLSRADSSVVGISMIGVDAGYRFGALQLKGQYYLSNISNTVQFNRITATDGQDNDLGKSMMGYYFEAGLNVLRPLNNVNQELIPFLRFEKYNTHHKVNPFMNRNPAYQQSIITSGITWEIARGAVIKMDMQFQKPDNASTYAKIFNAGIGVMF